MYVDNEYNQPEKAFEKLWWHKPTYKDLKEYGFSKKEAKGLFKSNKNGETKYWVESFAEDD